MSNEAWDSPIPLGVEAPLPFPTELVKAQFLREWIEAESEATQTPTDLAGVVGLGVIATACHGRVEVEVRPGYREPVNIYTVSALESGNRKSAVFAAATKPIFSLEDELAAERRKDVASNAALRRVLERRLSDAEAQAAKAKVRDSDASTELVNELSAQLAEYRVLTMPRFVVDDITPEALAGVLVEQKGILSILSAEGGIFETMGGRYSQGVPNLDVFLKGHSGDQVRVDRRGRPPESIERPCMTVALTVQPDVLRSLVDKPGFRGRGLMARILYSIPESTVGSRKIAPEPVPERVKDAYELSVARVLRGTEAMDEPVILCLSDDAHRDFVAFETKHELRLEPLIGDLAHMADWGSKLPGAVARLAGLLHVAEHVDDGWSQPIEVSTMNSAIGLGRYFVSHALRAFDMMRADRANNDASRLLRWIVSHRVEQFSRRDAHRALERAFPRADDLDGPLETLVERSYIRPIECVQTGRGRPASAAFSVNPRCWDALTVTTKLPIGVEGAPTESTESGSLGAHSPRRGPKWIHQRAGSEPFLTDDEIEGLAQSEDETDDDYSDDD